jgi:hypothetical protein
MERLQIISRRGEWCYALQDRLQRLLIRFSRRENAGDVSEG